MSAGALDFEALPDIARDAIRRALDSGATDAECTISEGSEFSANVRMGELETLKEAGSRGAGLRVLMLTAPFLDLIGLPAAPRVDGVVCARALVHQALLLAVTSAQTFGRFIFSSLCHVTIAP